jgi:hypothetical protein
MAIIASAWSSTRQQIEESNNWRQHESVPEGADIKFSKRSGISALMAAVQSERILACKKNLIRSGLRTACLQDFPNFPKLSQTSPNFPTSQNLTKVSHVTRLVEHIAKSHLAIAPPSLHG